MFTVLFVYMGSLPPYSKDAVEHEHILSVHGESTGQGVLRVGPHVVPPQTPYITVCVVHNAWVHVYPCYNPCMHSDCSSVSVTELSGTLLAVV